MRRDQQVHDEGYSPIEEVLQDQVTFSLICYSE